MSPKPDLQPYTPSGWDDSIVVSTGKSSRNAKKYTVFNNIFVSWAVKNTGGDITQTFKTTLFVDGAEKKTWTSSSLSASSCESESLYYLGHLSAGIHTVRLVTDSTGVISESDETNNDFSKTFVVAARTSSATVSDYNGSYKSDMIQFVNGLVYVTYSTDQGYVQTPAINDITGWNVVETRRDLTGDSLADIQITSDDGAGSTWVATLRNDYLKNNSITLNYQFIGAYNNKLWSYLGSADFNGDGKSEILMIQTNAGKDSYGHRNVVGWVTDEETCLWNDNLWIGSLTDEWNVAGTADVNGDGADNVLLRRSDGMIGYWSVAGTNDLVTLKNAGNRVLITTGDFDGDGTCDFLWQSADNGELSTWTDIDDDLTDTVIGKAGYLGGSWTFAGAGDYDADGKDEILWCDTSAYKMAYGDAEKASFSKLTLLA